MKVVVISSEREDSFLTIFSIAASVGSIKHFVVQLNLLSFDLELGVKLHRL